MLDVENLYQKLGELTLKEKSIKKEIKEILKELKKLERNKK